MKKLHPLIGIPISLLSLLVLPVSSNTAHAGTRHTGTKGAEIYCFMRNTGNQHELSWNAAYEVMKRQNNNLFKPSPKHGAVMIIEAVVKEPQNFKDCGLYLGDLFGGKTNQPESMGVISRDKEVEIISTDKTNNRYTY